MEVILCQDVPSLGQVGDILRVKDGYARNYLFPKKLAYVATAANIKKNEREKQKRASLEEQSRQEAETLAKKIAAVSFTVSVEVNDQEKLYGSVTDADIVKALEAEDFKIEKRQVLLEKPIQDLGIYEISIKLHPKVIAKARVWVTKK